MLILINSILGSSDLQALECTQIAQLIRTQFVVVGNFGRGQHTLIDTEFIIVALEIGILEFRFAEPHVGHTAKLGRIIRLRTGTGDRTIGVDLADLGFTVISINDMMEHIVTNRQHGSINYLLISLYPHTIAQCAAVGTPGHHRVVMTAANGSIIIGIAVTEIEQTHPVAFITGALDPHLDREGGEGTHDIRRQRSEGTNIKRRRVTFT